MEPTTVVLRIEIAALDNLVAYLRERDATQAAVDAGAAQINKLVDALSDSSVRLTGTVTQEQGEENAR